MTHFVFLFLFLKKKTKQNKYTGNGKEAETGKTVKGLLPTRKFLITD